jgi:hypothetical protein
MTENSQSELPIVIQDVFSCVMKRLSELVGIEQLELTKNEGK